MKFRKIKRNISLPIRHSSGKSALVAKSSEQNLRVSNRASLIENGGKKAPLLQRLNSVY